MRVSLHTFGCKANQYDTEVVRQALEAAGATVVRDGDPVDAAVVNSCTVTHVSEAKMRGLVRRIARANPDVQTVVMGCAAACDDGRIAALPNVTRVVEGSVPHEVLRALELPPVAIDPILRTFVGGARAWLKIQDGCDEHCTFCATTMARGASRSRPVEEIVREAAVLAQRHQEIVLTGVHIGAYGRELSTGETLASLVNTLVERVPAVRFRLSSVEATQVDVHLMDLMEHQPHRVAPHVHAPLQSGSDRVLRRMGRHWYTADTYRRRVEELASRSARLGLGADIMVGFPGETDDDFAKTVSLVTALPFTYLHVFPYSARPGVASGRLGAPGHPDVVAARTRELRAMAASKGAHYRRTRDGGTADVVVLRRRGGRCEGLTEDYLSASVPTDSPTPARFAARLQCRSDGDLWAVSIG